MLTELYTEQEGMIAVGESTSLVPRRIEGLPDIMLVSCGSHHTMCLDEDEALWVFGSNSHGQLGCAANDEPNPTPQKWGNDNMGRIVAISRGGRRTIIKDSLYSIWVSGSNEYGASGIRTTKDTQISTPTQTDIPGHFVDSRSPSRQKSAIKGTAHHASDRV
uniref:Uncharacterized protein n=1 Tax=Vannella robusta TaxID=1487602 RepID=A0A7S4M8Y7_9EUKA|mmetsp:Transcript_1495/g.1904  ORF Transcript_1495/g.1904 Transcript_1495/m.1904 type:complete len:162 (+) Transcript_1495:635-1120(+)